MASVTVVFMKIMLLCTTFLPLLAHSVPQQTCADKGTCSESASGLSLLQSPRQQREMLAKTVVEDLLGEAVIGNGTDVDGQVPPTPTPEQVEVPEQVDVPEQVEAVDTPCADNEAGMAKWTIPTCAGQFEAGHCSWKKVRTEHCRQTCGTCVPAKEADQEPETPMPSPRPVYQCSPVPPPQGGPMVDDRECPCDPLSCNHTWTCVQAHYASFSDQTKEACDNVFKHNASWSDEACCKDAMKECKAWKTECYTNLTIHNDWFPRSGLYLAEKMAIRSHRRNARQNATHLDESIQPKFGCPHR